MDKQKRKKGAERRIWDTCNFASHLSEKRRKSLGEQLYCSYCSFCSVGGASCQLTQFACLRSACTRSDCYPYHLSLTSIQRYWHRNGTRQKRTRAFFTGVDCEIWFSRALKSLLKKTRKKTSVIALHLALCARASAGTVCAASIPSSGDWRCGIRRFLAFCSLHFSALYVSRAKNKASSAHAALPACTRQPAHRLFIMAARSEEKHGVPALLEIFACAHLSFSTGVRIYTSNVLARS